MQNGMTPYLDKRGNTYVFVYYCLVVIRIRNIYGSKSKDPGLVVSG